jgi:hypothetical protein
MAHHGPPGRFQQPPGQPDWFGTAVRRARPVRQTRSSGHQYVPVGIVTKIEGASALCQIEIHHATAAALCIAAQLCLPSMEGTPHAELALLREKLHREVGEDCGGVRARLCHALVRALAPRPLASLLTNARRVCRTSPL